MRFVPTPTIARFFRSPAFLRILEGPRREGKTTGALWSWLYLAQSLPPEVLPYRVAVVRDTWTNLERSVLANIEEQAAQGLGVEWLEGRTQCRLGSGLVHLYLMGVDSVAKIHKLQGFGVGGLWLDEPAPAADISGGIPPEVLSVGITSLSQPGVPHRVVVTLNPGDEDFWLYGFTEAFRREQASKPQDIRQQIAWFNIPPGERVSFEDRERNRAALLAIGRGDLVARLVEGHRGQVLLGEAVVPEFSDRLHVAAEPLPILTGRPIVRLWDFGLNPTCVWTQVTPLGHWHILACVVGSNIGLEQLIETAVLPWEREYLRPQAIAWQYRDICDPAGFSAEQTNSERSCARVLIEKLEAAPERGVVAWTERRDSLRAVLNRMVRGRPLVQIDPECKQIVRALRGGFHYPKDGLGRITATVDAAKKASGIHSHPVDCLTYGAAELFPLPDMIAAKQRQKPKPVRPTASARPWMAA